MRDDLRDADILFRGAKNPATRAQLQAFIEHAEPAPPLDDDPAPPPAGKRKVSTGEDQFQTRVVTEARKHGWRAQATLRSRAHALVTEPGWPDIFLWHPGFRTFAAAELKVSLKAGATGAQVRVASELAWCGVRFFVWTPDDWPAIVAVLDGSDLPYRATTTAVVSE